MSYQYSAAAEIAVSETDEDERLHPVPAPLMISVCGGGLVLYGVALKLLLSS